MRKALAGDPRRQGPEAGGGEAITADFVAGRPGRADTPVSGRSRVTDDEERFLIAGGPEV
jgi:hypothetical protein